MIRIALYALAVVVAALIALALLPERERQVPGVEIDLMGVTLILYPEADPGAVWRFVAPEVSYDPQRSETTLYRIEDGARSEGGEDDFLLWSERIVIDDRDDLRGDLVYAYLLDSEECLTMRGDEEEPVLIDQRRGRFEVPQMRIQGEGLGDDFVWPQVSADFDLQDFQAGGMGTTIVNEFEVDGSDSDDPRRTACDDL